MSAVIDLLSECSAAGVKLFLDNGRLRYRARAGVYTEEIKQKVAAYKTELIAELSRRLPPATLDLTREDHRQEALPPEAKARRFKVTLKSGGVLLHSRPGGLTRQEAIELSKDWGEVAECVPAEEAPVTTPPVICGHCQHFQRIDHPHTGGCAQGHGRHWLWDTDRRRCNDFLNQARGGEKFHEVKRQKALS
jgi:tubulysin polyketide synthase-like protein